MNTVTSGLEPYRRELLKGNTEILILSMLAEDLKYGYQLVREMASRSRGYFRITQGTLYPALHRMERDGYVESMWITSPTHQTRRYYRITARGLERMRSMIREWDIFTEAFGTVAKPIKSLNRSGKR